MEKTHFVWHTWKTDGILMPQMCAVGSYNIHANNMQFFYINKMQSVQTSNALQSPNLSVAPSIKDEKQHRQPSFSNTVWQVNDNA